MTRIFLDDDRLRDDTVVIDGPDAHHMMRVLRMGVGDGFTVVGPGGLEYPAEIIELESDRLRARLGAPVVAAREPQVALTLYHGMPRMPRYETALRMCTELGVAAFVPVLSSRSVVRLSDREAERKTERLRRIVQSAARQCGRTHVPEVAVPMSFSQALKHFAAADMPGAMPAAALAGEPGTSLGEWASQMAAGADRLAIFIGPESGFDLDEQAAAERAGIVRVTMGPRILRTETAAAVAVTICLERLDMLR